MNAFLLSEMQKSSEPTSASDNLRTEREFRCFLLHILSNPKENAEILSTLSTFLDSEVEKYRLSAKSEESDPYAALNRLLTDGGEQIMFGMELSPLERSQFLSSIVPSEFSELREPISRAKIPISDFRTICHTLSYFASIEEENKALEKRIECLIDVSQFNPDASDVFISSSLSSRNLNKRTKSSKFSVPKTSRTVPSKKILSEESVQMISTDDLRTEVQKRKSEIEETSKTERKLTSRFEEKQRQIQNLQRDITRLSELKAKIEENERIRDKEEEESQARLESNILRARREANSVTSRLKEAAEENRRLKKIEKDFNL